MTFRLANRRFQEGTETFEEFRRQHEALLKKLDGLAAAKERAEEKSKAKTLFLANTCHDLVNTLNIYSQGIPCAVLLAYVSKISLAPQIVVIIENTTQRGDRNDWNAQEHMPYPRAKRICRDRRKLWRGSS